MSTYDDITTITDYFEANWGDEIEVVYDNRTPKTLPRDLWATFSVEPFGTRRISSHRIEGFGRVYLQLHAPQGSFDAQAWDAAHAFISMFSDWHSDDYRIRFGHSDIDTGEIIKGFFSITVGIDYTCENRT